MKVRFPAPDTLGTALILAAVLALAGYLLFPPLSHRFGGAALLAAGVAAGAFIRTGLAALRLDTSGRAAAGNGESKSIFVGNLAYRTSKEELQHLFGAYGMVRSVRIMTDRVTRRPRGFGFVEMDAAAAAAAIKALDGKEFYGRQLKVNEGNERKNRENQAA